jgi:PEP-CTERM motif
MNKIFCGGLLMTATLSGAFNASAANVLDQVNDVVSTFGTDSLNSARQYFTPSGNNISGAGFTLLYSNPLGPASIPYAFSLFEATSGALGAPVTRTLTVNGSAIFEPGVAQQLNVFWDPVIVDANKTYYLSLQNGGAQYMRRLSGSDGTLGGPYDRGQAFYSNGISPLPLTFGNEERDYVFRTFSDDTFQVSPVPEPAAWLLMLAGLSAVGVMAKRRKIEGS